MYYRRALLPVWRFCIFWFLGVAVLYGPDVYRDLTAIGAAEVRDHSTKKREAISISNEELLESSLIGAVEVKLLLSFWPDGRSRGSLASLRGRRRAAA